MDGKDHSGKVSDKWRAVTGHWRNGSCYEVAKNLAEVCSSVLWKVELVSNETGYLAEKIKKAFKEWFGSSWLLKEKDELRKKLLSKKKPELKDLGNSQACP